MAVFASQASVFAIESESSLRVLEVFRIPFYEQEVFSIMLRVAANA